MDTKEHTELGNALKFRNIKHNPYFRVDEKGIVYLRLQRFGESNFPEPMALEMSAGEIIAMAGDYFTQADWTMTLDLPSCEPFRSPSDLGHYLIQGPITEAEEIALISAYNNLAAPDVTRKEIDRIYTINSANYIPFSATLNAYMKQLMLYFRVKNYGEMITRNQTHFTPWSIKVYTLGHAIALRFARLSFELKELANNEAFTSDNPDLHKIKSLVSAIKGSAPSLDLIELAHRYQAQAYSMELFTFHYYTDHFATGHMSMIADLRTKLQDHFGTLGSILANNLHDEVNRVGAYTCRPYDPTPNVNEAATGSRGDGTFDTCLNKFNRKNCLAGMTHSMADIAKVIKGKPVPAQTQFGGLEYLPDVDFNSRQHQPLLVYSEGRIFYREHPSHIDIISPSEYEKLRAWPLENGYKELTSKWDAFRLVTKLRLFPYLYHGRVLPVDKDRLAEIESDEKQRAPMRKPIPRPKCRFEEEPSVLDWRTRKERMDTLDGLNRYSVLQFKHKKRKHRNREPLEIDSSRNPAL